MGDRPSNFNGLTTPGTLVQLEKFDMVINCKTWTLLRSAIKDKDLISPDLVKSHCWKLVVIDDNNVSDDVVRCLSEALMKLGISDYYSMPINDLSLEVTKAHIRKYNSDDVSWSSFFNFDENGKADYLESCIFFSDPIKFLLLRTGDVRHMIYAGPSDFLQVATGIDMEKMEAVAVGSYWPDERIEKLYKPLKLLSLPSGIT